MCLCNQFSACSGTCESTLVFPAYRVSSASASLVESTASIKIFLATEIHVNDDSCLSGWYFIFDCYTLTKEGTHSPKRRYFNGRLRHSVSEGLNIHQHCHRNFKSRKRGNVYGESIDWVCVTFDSWQRVGVWNDRAVCVPPQFNFWIIWPNLRKLSHLRPLQRRSFTISNHRPASWSSGQSLCLLIMRSWVRFPVLPWEFSLKGRIPAVTMVWVG